MRAGSTMVSNKNLDLHDTALENCSQAYMRDLNEMQIAAVLHTEGALLVLAGAGTGKTRVLTTRLAHILHQSLAYPSQILAVTFTNKAAQEMRERVSKLLQRPCDEMWIGTFHSLASRILRRHAEHVGLQQNFTIMSADDQLRLVKQLLKTSPFIDKDLNPKDIVSRINKLKDKGINAQKSEDFEDPIVSSLYKIYQERLLMLNVVDFGDLLLYNLVLFQEFPNILTGYQKQFKYILVDEYQDTNTGQYLWVRLLSKGYNNICCVGDDDQSIYGWRGAEVGNILRFEKDFQNPTLIRLEQNYRSTAPILKAANGLIAHNNGRYTKTLWTEQLHGQPIEIRSYYDGDQEARGIGAAIEESQRQRQSLNEIAILVRATFQTRTFEECFMSLGIPYRVIGGLRFYERQEIRDCIAYLRLLSQENDGLAFERIINLPKRGIGDTTMQRLHHFAREQGISLPKAARFAAENILTEVPIQSKARAALLQFFQDFDRWKKMLEKEQFIDVVKTLLDESGYTAMWLSDKTPEAAGRIENIKEFVQALSQFESLMEFLEHVSLVLDVNSNQDEEMVTLMTLHAAKGLEFNTVFLPGWEEGLFPHPRSFAQEYNIGIEEERRLAYVGISRAKVRAIISYAFRRRAPQGWQSAQPSRFINEIPLDVMVQYSPSGTLISSKGIKVIEVPDINQVTQEDAFHSSQEDPQYSNWNRESKGRSGTYPQQASWRNRNSYSYDNQNTDYRKKIPSGMSGREYGKSFHKKKQDVLTSVKTHTFKTGDTVSHTTFGEGKVVAFEGDKLLIDFKEGGLRKIVAAFVTHSLAPSLNDF